MALVANNPKAAKRLGISSKVGKEFMKADKGKKFNEGGSTRGGPRSRSRAGYERLQAKEEADKEVAEKAKARLDRLKEAAVSRYKKGTRSYAREALHSPPGSFGYKTMKFLRQNISDPLNEKLERLYGSPRTTPIGVEGPEATDLRARRERLGYRKGGSVKSSASRRADGIAQRGKTRGKFI